MMKSPTVSRLMLAAALATGALFATTGCAVVRDQQSVGAYIDDATITTRVKTRLAEDRTVSAMAIKVESLNGVVQLAGFAKTPDERMLAEQLARGTPGVQDVRNDIIVQK
ncbi:MAG: BON domain-containing protein [Gammaproteobacteria bacterium]